MPSRSTPRIDAAAPADGSLRASSAAAFLAAVGCGVLGTWIMWAPLFGGAGLIGGDLYPYFFPQKQFYSDSLHAGTIPLWSPLVGFGYPVLGESQTGALYPPHLLLYSTLSVHAAYVANQLVHYVVAFVALFAFARRLSLGPAGGLLAATVFTFGWFPPRICLEWAIIGGCWFAAILWSSTAWLQTGRRRYAALTALFLGLNLLAGHYNLAFITLLMLVPLPWLIPETPGVRNDKSEARGSWRRRGLLWLAVFIGFLNAGVQLLPTWELKSVSQREEENIVFAPTYGHLPPEAISQLWMPWRWYAAEVTTDALLEKCNWLAVRNDLGNVVATNQVEAQLYLGLLPLALAIAALVAAVRTPESGNLKWGLVIVAGLVLATGWPTHFLHALPGIGFFRGPGRYSILVACGIAVLSGRALDAFLAWRNWNRLASGMCVGLVLAITLGDLWSAARQYKFVAPDFGRQVFYATIVDNPPINFVPESTLRTYFAPQRDFARLHAPGQNMPTLLNVSALPVYLGLGPAVYESPELLVDFRRTDPREIAEAVARLRKFGVTHLLLEHELDPALWPVSRIGEVLDPVLNRTFARREPFFFYQLQQPGLRFEFLDHPDQNRITKVAATPHEVRVEFAIAQPDRLVFRDLWFPGWEVTGGTNAGRPYEQIFREVAVAPAGKAGTGSVTWTYKPASVRNGAVTTAIGLLFTALLAVRWRRPRKTE